ncbi:MAG: DEAD/DEAH box helicase [Cyclobacteriaceae bacterium]
MESTGKKTWGDLKLNKQILNAVDELGYAEPTEIQQRCTPLILGGQQLIGIAQTGTGKTAAYCLPLIMKIKFAQGNDARALVLAPTKELVLQLAEQTRLFSKFTDIRTVALYGGVGIKPQLEALTAGVDIIVSTPGRFLELYGRGDLVVKQIKTLVIDEADRLMDMGFMPQLRRIFEVIPQKRQNLLFSATFPPKVERLADEFLEFPHRIEVTPQATVASKVKQLVFKTPNMKTKVNLLEFLLQQPGFDRVMVFTRTKEAADNVFKFIERKSMGPVRVIHSNKGQNSRINAMSEFKDGTLRVLVSTDVSARGIDVTNVTHVINFDVPIVYEDYVHRTGRTGRAFQKGTAITFCTVAEGYHLDKIEKLIKEKITVEKLPESVEVPSTSFEEAQEMAREIDRQKRKEDPTFGGAFHEKKHN